MTDTYEPPVWRWDVAPEAMAAEIHARKNPFDAVWLARLRIELGNEDHQHRCVTRDAVALQDVRDRTRHLRQVSEEIALLETADIAGDQLRRQREDAERRELEERETERMREREAAELARIEDEKHRQEVARRGLGDAAFAAMEALKAELQRDIDKGMSLEEIYFGTLLARSVDAELRLDELEQRLVKMQKGIVGGE